MDSSVELSVVDAVDVVDAEVVDCKLRVDLKRLLFSFFSFTILKNLWMVIAAATISAGWCCNSLDLSSDTAAGAGLKGLLGLFLKSLSSTCFGTEGLIPLDVGGTAGREGFVGFFPGTVGRSTDCIGVLGRFFKAFFSLELEGKLTRNAASDRSDVILSCLFCWSLKAFLALKPL